MAGNVLCIPHVGGSVQCQLLTEKFSKLPNIQALVSNRTKSIHEQTQHIAGDWFLCASGVS